MGYPAAVYAPSIPDDADLARRILAAGLRGDVEAERELCQRFAPRIRLYGRRHLRSDAAAADLVQDVLLLTLQKLRGGELREPDRIASFILGTCRQTVIDGRRGGSRRERILDTFSASLPALTAEAEDAPDSARLAQCLERLAERERSVLVMSFYDERAAGDVAASLGLTAGNVRVIRHRGIERLRLCMNGMEPA